MHVDIIPNRQSKPCALIRESFREDGKVRHRTLVNISDEPPERIMAIKRALKGDFDNLGSCGSESFRTEQGPQFGALHVLARIAKEIGLVKALGSDRQGRLALLLVVAQVISGMSRRAVVQWARNQAVNEVLGVGSEDRLGFDEHDLYEILDDLADRRFEIELDLFRTRKNQCGRLFLYDVTSSYLEGTCNELADWGYNRDGKRGKKQIVIGLLTDKNGDPVAVDVFKGNTSDPKTVIDQIRRLADRFRVSDVVFVGDRGMLKSVPLESINEAGFHYITAITKPQIESLMRQGVLQLNLFDEALGEVDCGAVRYVFRRNPVRVLEIEESRRERIEKAQSLARQLSEGLVKSARKSLEVAVRRINEKVIALKIDGLVTVTTHDRTISVEVDPESYDDRSRLDGVYVLKTDLGSSELGSDEVHRVYKSLSQVETDFRTMKTDLQVRPVHVRRESRTRGHVLVVMLALIVRRELHKRLKKAEISVTHAIDVLNGWALLRESLGNLRFNRVPEPNQVQLEILNELGVKIPRSLSIYSKQGRRKAT